MGERSSELRQALVESVKSKRVSEEYQKESESPYIRYERREQLRKNLEEEMANVTAFEQTHTALLERCTEMSDEEFAVAYEKASAELDGILNRMKRYSDEYQESRPFTVDFVEIKKLTNLSEFLEAFPMQFIPRKQEIGRILALAKQMHETRAERGEIKSTEPIEIVDIGGASGALGKLITDLARENGIEISYTIIDPDRPSVQAASEFYAGDPQLTFVEQTGEAFNKEISADSPEIIDLMAERDKLIKEGEQKRADLQKVVEMAKDEKTLDTTKIQTILQILRTDFEIDLPSTLVDDSADFLQVFEDDYDTYPSRSFVDKYMNSWREKVDGLTAKIENRLGKEAAKFDLVINSWMPVRMDLTKEVRGSNGAAILYAIEWYGATGCRSDAPYPEKPTQLGQGESYNPGANYESQVGWISHSTPQVKGMQSSQPDKLWKRQSSLTLPFSNAFIVQTKKGYGEEGVLLHPEDAGIKIMGEYPWEQELDQKGGDISPLTRLQDKDGKLNYFSPFHELLYDIQDHEKAKLDMK